MLTWGLVLINYYLQFIDTKSGEVFAYLTTPRVSDAERYLRRYLDGDLITVKVEKKVC